MLLDSQHEDYHGNKEESTLAKKASSLSASYQVMNSSNDKATCHFHTPVGLGKPQLAQYWASASKLEIQLVSFPWVNSDMIGDMP